MLESRNSSLREELIRTSDDKEYRYAYADENLNATIATQIKVLREQRGWKQMDLAKEAEMKQPMISRYENVNYSSWSINTLKRLAFAFDVILDVRFRSFRDLVESTEEFGRESLQVPRFTEDPYFKEEDKEPKKDKKEQVAAEMPQGVHISGSALTEFMKAIKAETQKPISAAEQVDKSLTPHILEKLPISQAIVSDPTPPSRGTASDALRGDYSQAA